MPTVTLGSRDLEYEIPILFAEQQDMAQIGAAIATARGGMHRLYAATIGMAVPSLRVARSFEQCEFNAHEYGGHVLNALQRQCPGVKMIQILQASATIMTDLKDAVIDAGDEAAGEPGEVEKTVGFSKASEGAPTSLP